MHHKSQDLNNLHFGVVGKATDLFSEETMLRQAGIAEIVKWEKRGKEVPYAWKPSITIKYTSDPYDGYRYYKQTILMPPYGDNPIDHKMILKGFEYYKKNRSSLDEDWW